VLLTHILVSFIGDWLIGALELYCPRLMILMCVDLKMFLEGRRKEGLGVIRRVEKAEDFLGGWLGIGGEQDRKAVMIIL
jgi:hypothetical protein